MIFSQIQLRITHSHIFLFFSTIIFEFCAKMGVLFIDDEEWMQPMKRSDDSYLRTKKEKRANEFPLGDEYEEEGPRKPAQPSLPPQPGRRSNSEKFDQLGIGPLTRTSDSPSTVPF